MKFNSREFGSTESIFIAFGNKDVNILNQKALKNFLKLAKELKKLKSVQNVMSVLKITQTRVDNIDGFLEINQLQDGFALNKSLQSIELYLNENKKLKKQLIAKNGSTCRYDYPDTIIGLVQFRDDAGRHFIWS